MLLPRFCYREPESLEQALVIMNEVKGKGLPLAGGTDLLVNMKKGIMCPENLICVSGIQKLRQIHAAKGKMNIGACVRVGELAKSNEIRTFFSALAEGAMSLGSPLIRNMATIGGNIVTARPAADLPPSLMAYGARIMLRNIYGERLVVLEDFFKGPGETIRKSEEIVTEILLNKPPEYSGAAYMKLGVRQALEISIVNVAVYMELNAKDGAICKPRVILGSVAPTPIRAFSSEQILSGEKPSKALFESAAEAASSDCKPITDFRASEEYRKDMVKVLTKRALVKAYREARKE